MAHALVCYLVWFGSSPARATIGVAYQMLLGNPSGATADTNNHQSFLIQRDVQALDYSDSLRQPNWASWHLTAADLGSSGRSGTFFVDSSLPPNFYWVKTTDYSGSGYDRGHMCPSADRTDTVAHNEQTFFMSNIIPQAPDNNQGVWANLESYSRTLANAGNEVLITCGPEGFGSNRTASAGQIPIASNVWKVIVVVPSGAGATLDRINTGTRVIAVNIPNVQGVNSQPWQGYLTSVNQLQASTGLTFFTALNPDVAAVLRAKVDGAAPVGITGFTPGAGTASASVVITGTNFAGVAAVRFNGINAPFTVTGSNQISANVPIGATTGPISVLAAGGLAMTTNAFSVSTPVLQPPVLSIALVTNRVVLTWPVAAGPFTLQQCSNLSAGLWTDYPGFVSDDGTNKTVTLSEPTSSIFFRLLAAP